MANSSAPTLLIGVGGQGSKIITRIIDRVSEDRTKRVEYVVMDTDANDLGNIKAEYPSIFTVQTSPNMTVGECLKQNDFAREKWFPRNPILDSKALTEGAGQVRAVSRLALEQTIVNGGLSTLIDAIKKLQLLSADEFVQGVRVVVVGTIAGGTGSGLFLPLGLYLKNYLKSECGIKGVNIRGFFILPDVMGTTVLADNQDQQENMRANAYAAVRELDAFVARGDGDDLDNYPAVEFDIPRPASKERVPYPPVLPYDHMFLMDCRNADGKTLGTLDDYLDYAADTIYSFAISPMSRRSNSSEDNEIRRISNVADNGHCRYAAAGSAEIVYPMDRVAEYVALLWAKDSIGAEWIELDTELKEKQKKAKRLGEDFDYSEQYVASFKHRAREQGVPFYRVLWNQVEGTMKQKINLDEEDAPRDITLFPRQVIADAPVSTDEEDGEEVSTPVLAGVQDVVVENDGSGKYLHAITNAARGQLEEDPRFHRENEDFVFSYNNLMYTTAESIGGDIARFEDIIEPYQRKVSNIVPVVAKEIAAQLFSLSDFRDPFDNPQDSNFEKWIIKVGGASTDVLHPNAIRYIAYQSERNLRDILAIYMANKEKLWKRIQDQLKYDYDPDEEGVQSARTTAGSLLDEKPSFFSNLFSKIGGGGDEVDMALVREMIIMPLSSIYSTINGWVDCELMCAVCREGLNFFTALNRSFEKFYDFLEEKIPTISRTIASYENSRIHNAHAEDENGILGSSKRYVCSDRTSLEGIAADTPRLTDASELEGTVSANIYRAVLRMAGYDLKNSMDNAPAKKKGQTMTLKEKRLQEQAQRNQREEFFGKTYEDSVLGFWKTQVIEQYSDVIDMDIVDALRKEAIYAGKIGDSVDEHAMRVLRTGWTLSEVFLDKTSAHNSDRLKACMFDQSLLDGEDDNKRAVVDEVLGRSNAASDPNLTRQQVLFYQASYGIAVKNLEKFSVPKGVDDDDYKAIDAANNGGFAGGTYYRAYNELIRHLSDNLSKGSYITPHLDARWHLAFQFPDIDYREGKRQRYNVVRAFVYAILFKRVQDRRDVRGYLYEVVDKGRTYPLKVWDSKCDEFYEIFEALMINNSLVSSLLDDSQKNRIAEQGLSTLSSCYLAGNLRSEALGWKPEGAETDGRFTGDLMTRIHNGAYNREGLFIDADDKLPGVTGIQSIYEIPLFYELTLPAASSHGDFIEEMIDSLHGVVVSYLNCFCNEAELYDVACRFLLEQYDRFRCRLMLLLEQRPEILTSSSVASRLMAKLNYWIEDEHQVHICEDSYKKWKQYRSEWEAYLKEFDEKHAN